MSINMESESVLNLNSLYEAMQIVARKASEEYPIEITPIGGETLPIYAFSVFFAYEPLAIVFTKDVANNIAALMMFSFKDIQFKYIIRALSDEKYSVASQNDYSKLLDTKVSQVSNIQPQEYTYSQVLEFLKSECLPLNEKLKRTIISVANSFKENRSLTKFLLRIANKIGRDSAYSYSKEAKTFHFSPKDEDEFHRLFFSRGVYVRYICRYCSLESLYQILSNQTIRMNGLVGMNDKSEYRYAWESFWGKEDGVNEMENQMNRTYIMSCSAISSKDNLEMWRLYGDDGKGVCLIFEVKKPTAPFILARTIYEFTNDGKRNINDNKWTILKKLTGELKSIGLPLRLENQNKWLSFLKSGDYWYEQEIRLLYAEPEGDHLSKQWVLTKNNSIINPYVQFDLLPKEIDKGIVIPLSLKGIILGPKCPEKEINIKQLENMLGRDPELKEFDVKVSISEITNYR